MTLGAQSPRQRNGDTGLSDGILPETPICESENMQIVLKKMAEGFSIESGYQRLQAAFETSDELLVDSPSLGKVLLMKLPDGSLRPKTRTRSPFLVRPAPSRSPVN